VLHFLCGGFNFTQTARGGEGKPVGKERGDQRAHQKDRQNSVDQKYVKVHCSSTGQVAFSHLDTIYSSLRFKSLFRSCSLLPEVLLHDGDLARARTDSVLSLLVSQGAQSTRLSQ